MSLSSTLSSALGRAAAPAALAVAALFGMAANSNAAEQCLPGVYDAQRGVKGGDCYTTPEINKAMQAFKQRTLIVADRIGFGESDKGVYSVARVNRFTSNPEGTTGFNVEGDAPSNQPTTKWTVGAVFRDIRLYDRDRPILPTEEAVGRLNAQGIQKSGDRLMMSAKYDDKYMVVVARGTDPSVGSFLVADSQKGSGLAGLKNLDYSDLGKSIIRQQTSQQVSMVAPAPKN